MKIIGYTYEADVHCIGCAVKRSRINGFALNPDSLNAPNSQAIDEHGLSIHAIDNEGNPIHPIFSTDEWETPPFCGDCHGAI